MISPHFVQMQCAIIVLKIDNACLFPGVIFQSDHMQGPTCVPAVSATRPGKLRFEREEEIQESPGQYDDVIDTGV